MTALTLGLQGHLVGRYHAALGAARVLAAAWPDIALHWGDDMRAVVSGGPASIDEAAEQITAATLDTGTILPGVDDASLPAKIDLGAPQTVAWGGPEGMVWQIALTGHFRQWLHPMIRPHAAQTVAGMLGKAGEVTRSTPGMLARTLRGVVQHSTAYPGGLWIERSAGDPGAGGSAAPAALDWLTIMALPWMPVREIIDPSSDVGAVAGSALGWRLHCHPRHHGHGATGAPHTSVPYVRWQLWTRPIPVAVLPELLRADRIPGAGPTFAAHRARRVRRQDPPMMERVDPGSVTDHDGD